METSLIFSIVAFVITQTLVLVAALIKGIVLITSVQKDVEWIKREIQEIKDET